MSHNLRALGAWLKGANLGGLPTRGNPFRHAAATHRASRKKTPRSGHHCADRRESPLRGVPYGAAVDPAAGCRQGKPPVNAPPTLDVGQQSGRKSPPDRTTKALCRIWMTNATRQQADDMKEPAGAKALPTERLSRRGTDDTDQSGSKAPHYRRSD